MLGAYFSLPSLSIAVALLYFFLHHYFVTSIIFFSQHLCSKKSGSYMLYIFYTYIYPVDYIKLTFLLWLTRKVLRMISTM